MLPEENRFQIFMEYNTSKLPARDSFLRKGICCTNLARIRQKLREGALERLADRPGKRRKMVAWDDYEPMKRGRNDKGLALDEQELELVIVKRRMGICGIVRGF